MTQDKVPVVGETIGHALLQTLCGYPIKVGEQIIERSDVHLMTTTTDDIEHYELVLGTKKTYRRVR